MLLTAIAAAFLGTSALAQADCPGYAATNVQQSSSGLTADLYLAGAPCNVYGTDLPNLTLTVEYQSGRSGAMALYYTDEPSDSASCHH